jgi:hypothetical protein
MNATNVRDLSERHLCGRSDAVDRQPRMADHTTLEHPVEVRNRIGPTADGYSTARPQL